MPLVIFWGGPGTWSNLQLDFELDFFASLLTEHWARSPARLRDAPPCVKEAPCLPLAIWFGARKESLSGWPSSYPAGYPAIQPAIQLSGQLSEFLDFWISRFPALL